MANITITKWILRSPITKKKTIKSPSIFSTKMTIFNPFCSRFRHILITKKLGKSLSPQYLKITKSPIFWGTNHQITNIIIAKSPSPQLLKITKSPIFSCTNHQITNKKIAQSPITKNTSPPLINLICVFRPRDLYIHANDNSK